jgi:hypothetical protein
MSETQIPELDGETNVDHRRSPGPKTKNEIRAKHPNPALKFAKVEDPGLSRFRQKMLGSQTCRSPKAREYFADCRESGRDFDVIHTCVHHPAGIFRRCLRLRRSPISGAILVFSPCVEVSGAFRFLRFKVQYSPLEARATPEFPLPQRPS